MDTKPFYPHSFVEAKANGDEEYYVLSHSANIDCKSAIEKAINENYDGMRLKKDITMPVIKEFGFDRVKYVLSYTFQNKDWDGRISNKNKVWAKETFVPKDMVMDRDRRNEFLVDCSTGLIDLFANQFKREFANAELLKKEQIKKTSVLQQLKEDKKHTTQEKQLQKKDLKQDKGAI